MNGWSALKMSERWGENVLCKKKIGRICNVLPPSKITAKVPFMKALNW